MQFKRFRSQLMNFAAPLQRWINNDRGNVSLMFGIAAIPIFAVGTMAIDYNNGVRLKGELQSAADAAVLAAAVALASGHDDTSKEQLAEDTFYANLSDNSQAAFTSTPHTDVDFDNRIITMTVEVATDQLITTLLTDKINISVNAKAIVDAGNPICMIAFNPTAKESLYVNGTADVLADGCSVHVNSNHEEAMRQVGSGQAEAESFCVRGGYEGSNYTPQPQKNCTYEKDPLAGYFDGAWNLASAAMPACTNLNSLNLFPNGNNGNGNNNNGGTIAYLQPGIYCGDLVVSSGDTLILTGSDTSVDPEHALANLYIFMDGDITVNGGGEIRNFWNNSEGTPPAGNFNNPSQQAIVFGPNTPGGTLDVQGGSDVWINAKSTGTFAGVAIAQHKDAVLNNNDTHYITGGGDVNINGIVYLPTQPLEIGGNGIIGENASQFAIMADTIEVRGTGSLEIRIGADYQAAGLPELPEAQERIRLLE